MDITPKIPAGRQVIEGYGDGGFRVGGVRHTGSVLVFPGTTEAWPVGSAANIAAADLAPVLARAAEIELLLLGCGRFMVPLKAELRQQLRRAGIVVEAMDSGAACRTYNVLLAEGRQVAAALIAV